MDTALDLDFSALEEAANDDVVSEYADDETEVALFPQIRTLTDRQFVSVLREDPDMLDRYLAESFIDVEETVTRMVAHGILRYEFEALEIGAIYHRHFIKLSMATLMFCLHGRNYSRFSDRCSTLLVAAPLVQFLNPVLMDPTMVDGPSLRLSIIFQVALRFACDITTNRGQHRDMRQRFIAELDQLELSYSEHLGLLAALDRYMQLPDCKLDASVTRQ